MPDETEPYSDVANQAHWSAARMANAKQASMMSAQAERINSTQAALAGTVVVDQLQKSFPLDGRNLASRIGNAIIPLTPLFLVKPEKRGTGMGSYVSDPRVWSLALVAGIVATKELVGRRKPSIARNIPELDQGRHLQLQLAGGADPQNVEWASDNDSVLTVDKNNGVVTAVGKGGSATITAKADGHEDSVVVRVR
jgi:hypothetical protein